MKRLREILSSLELCLWLIFFVSLSLAIGSFGLKGESAAAINKMPLSHWLAEAPLALSWWLWLTLVLLFFLVVNTLLCSYDSLRQRWGRVNVLSISAPQLIHAGFLMIAAAHFISAFGAYVQQFEVYKGAQLRMPDGRSISVADISVKTSLKGIPVGFSSELAIDSRNPATIEVISPNQPWFSGGYGVYIKHAELYPYPRALLEIHREPGAGLALAGAMVFTFGNVLVLWLRSKRGENAG